jgi:hypothetical protein
MGKMTTIALSIEKTTTIMVPSVIIADARKTSIITQATKITTTIIICTAILPHVGKITITIVPYNQITLFGFVGLRLEGHNLDYKKNIISRICWTTIRRT